MSQQLRKGSGVPSRLSPSSPQRPRLIEVTLETERPGDNRFEALWAIEELQDKMQDGAAEELKSALNDAEACSHRRLSRTGLSYGFDEAIAAAFAKLKVLALDSGRTDVDTWEWDAAFIHTKVTRSAKDKMYVSVWTWIDFAAQDPDQGPKEEPVFSRKLRARSTYNQITKTWQASLHCTQEEHDKAVATAGSREDDGFTLSSQVKKLSLE